MKEDDTHTMSEENYFFYEVDKTNEDDNLKLGKNVLEGVDIVKTNVQESVQKSVNRIESMVTSAKISVGRKLPHYAKQTGSKSANDNFVLPFVFLLAVIVIVVITIKIVRKKSEAY